MRKMLLVPTLLFGLTQAALGEAGFVEKKYKDPAGTEYSYVLFVPHDYKKGTPTPTILFLHGAGETKPKGTAKGKMPVEVGLGQAIKKREKTFPFLTIIPQAPVRGWQHGGESARMALGILADVEKEYSVDPKRLYLTGLSMGGFGTWSLAAAMPEKWAAIVPICGGGDPKAAEKIKDIPCWCFHGDADAIVKPELSRNMIEALKKAGGSPRYDEFKGVGHNSWDQAYAMDELYDWLLKQSRK